MSWILGLKLFSFLTLKSCFLKTELSLSSPCFQAYSKQSLSDVVCFSIVIFLRMSSVSFNVPLTWDRRTGVSQIGELGRYRYPEVSIMCACVRVCACVHTYLCTGMCHYTESLITNVCKFAIPACLMLLFDCLLDLFYLSIILYISCN